MEQAADAAPTVHDALAVIKAFNSTSNEVDRESANRWLAAFQKSIFAWTISDEILRQGNDLNACFFAAQTMRTKLQYSFYELPAETHGSLKDSLLEHASHLTAHSPAAITSQLCVAVTHLYFQMTSWTTDAMTELFTRFGNNKQHWYMLVELLQTIAEELNSRHLSVSTARKDELIKDLSRFSGTIVQFLTACVSELDALVGRSNGPADSEFARLNATNVDIAIRMRIRVYLCLGSSLLAHVLDENDLLATNGLFEPAFSFLTSFNDSDVELHDAITECICSAMIACEDLNRYGRLGERLHRYVLALEDAYVRAESLQQIDAACNICRIWTETAETFFDHFFVSPPASTAFGDSRLLEQLLVCVGHSSHQLAEITLPFWFNLLERLRRLVVREMRADEPPPNGSSSSPSAHRSNSNGSDSVTKQQAADLVERFESLLRRLLMATVHRCEYEDSSDGSENDSEFEDFRRRAADLLQDLAVVLGAPICAALIGDMLVQASSATSSPRWQLAEACLFALRYVVLCVDGTVPFDLTASLLEYALGVPTGDERTPAALSRTCLTLVGELARCVGVRSSQRGGASSSGDASFGEEAARCAALLERALSQLFAALRNVRLGPHAARALAQVCTGCRAALVAHFDTLLEIVAQCDAFALRNDASLELTKCVALTLAELPAHSAAHNEQIVTVLRHVMRVELDKVLVCAAKTDASTIDRKRQRPDDPCVHLDRMGVLFRYLTFPRHGGTSRSRQQSDAGDAQHPVAIVATEIWPDFLRVLDHYKASNRVSERCCRCIRFMLRSARHSMVVLLDAILDVVTRLYVETGHTCFLYLASVVIDEFGTDSSLQPKLIEMTIRLTGPTVQRFTEVPESMVSQPDAVEDFFRLATRSFQRMPQAFVEADPLVTSTLLCAIPAIRIQHKDAHCAVKRFLHEFIDALGSMQRDASSSSSSSSPPPYNYPKMNEKVVLIGSQLVNNVLLACLFDLPSYMVVESAELLYTVRVYNDKAFSEWLVLTLKQLASSDSIAKAFRVTEDDLHAFHRDLMAAKNCKQFSSKVNQFSRLFRR